MIEVVIILSIITLTLAIILVQYDTKKVTENVADIYIDIADVVRLTDVLFKRIDQLENELEKLKGE